MDDRQRSGREVDFDTAELAQIGAVVLIIVSVTLIVLGQQRVIAKWLALGLGAAGCGRGRGPVLENLRLADGREATDARPARRCI